LKLFSKLSRPGKLRLSLVIALSALLFLPFTSSGKVFLNRLLAKGSPVFETTAAWRRIYQASMNVNGAPAALSIHGCDEPLALVKTRLKQSFGAAGMENEKFFYLSAAAGGRLTRLLALAMPGQDKSLIFVFSQPATGLSKTTAVPPPGIFSDYALLPGSRVETTIKNEETGAMLETRLTDAAPETVIAEIAAKLSRHGWQQASPAGDSGNAKQRFLIFRRGEALCTVLAGPALRENKTCVTILHKEKNGQ